MKIMEFYSDKKKIEFTDAMKDYVIKKVEKLKRFVDSVDGRATLKKEGHQLKLEIAIPRQHPSFKFWYRFL